VSVVAECGQVEGVRVVFGGHGFHMALLGDGMAGPCAMDVHEIGNKASRSALLSGMRGKVFYWHLEAPCDIFAFFDEATWLL